MQKVNLNLIPGGVRPVINVSQYDEGRQFQLAIYDGSASYDLTGKTVVISGTKRDGHGFSYGSTDTVHGVAVVATSGNVATITTPQQMTAAGGECEAELTITDSSSNIVHTLNFVLMVEHAALGDQTIVSDTEIPGIIDAANANANRAEAAVEHYPYIDNTTKHWMVWDAVNGEWSDTGVTAQGANSYTDLTSKPSINSVVLSGNKTAADLSLASDSAMTGATSGTAGAKGLVPAPAAGDEDKFLCGDGTWKSGGGGSLPTPVSTANGGTGNADGYIRTGQKNGTTIGQYATAEGDYNTSSAYCSHAEGYNNSATGDRSHAEGSGTTASGGFSHAQGVGTLASSDCTHASGRGTKAQYNQQTAIGRYNDNQSDSLFEVGNGTADNARSNAIAVKDDGRIIKGASNAFPAASNLATPELTKAASVSAPHTKSYEPGEYVFIIEDDKQYKVIGSSTVGTTTSFIVDTNIEEVTTGGELRQLSSDIANKTSLTKTDVGANSIKTYVDSLSTGSKIEWISYASNNPDAPSAYEGYAQIIHMSSNYKAVIAFSRDGNIYVLQKAVTWGTWKTVTMT